MEEDMPESYEITGNLPLRQLATSDGAAVPRSAVKGRTGRDSGLERAATEVMDGTSGT